MPNAFVSLYGASCKLNSVNYTYIRNNSPGYIMYVYTMYLWIMGVAESRRLLHRYQFNKFAYHVNTTLIVIYAGTIITEKRYTLSKEMKITLTISSFCGHVTGELDFIDVLSLSFFLSKLDEPRYPLFLACIHYIHTTSFLTLS